MSYRAEQGFIHIAQILTKGRSRQDIVESGDLRLKLSGFVPDITGIENNQCSL